MLTINKQKIARGLEAVITVPTDMSPEDRSRLDRLAAVFYGHRVQRPDSYVFTDMRGRKCWLLFCAGFDARRQYAKVDRQCIFHPSNKRAFLVSEALDLAKILEAEKIKNKEEVLV